MRERGQPRLPARRLAHHHDRSKGRGVRGLRTRATLARGGKPAREVQLPAPLRRHVRMQARGWLWPGRGATSE